MTTNPNNIVRTRARLGGRASILEANAWCQPFSAGLLEGNGVIQNTSADMNVLVGGSNSKPDVLIAQSPAGYKIALDIVGQQAVALTAPATNSRVSAIVAYTDDLALVSEDTTVTGSPSSCGLIVVNGGTSSSPSAPTESAIRSAITADGATGSQAVYCVIAEVTVASTTTAITDSLISINRAGIGSQNVDFTTPRIYVARGTNDSRPTYSFAASEDCVVEVEALTTHTWGYGGATLTLALNSPNLTRLWAINGIMTGGDTVGRQLQAKLLGTANAGDSVTVTVPSLGSTGVSCDILLIIKCYPLGEINKPA